nr:DUF5683 domain-containing protein [Paludibacter sp. 221]
MDTVRTRKEAFKPDPEKAIWLGAIIPGFGQIVNKKYWKLPIVYGGYMGCAFAITWLSGEYNFYKYAYLDIIDKDDTTNSFMDPIPDGYTVEYFYGSMETYKNTLKSGMDNYRRYRDLSILVSVVFYGLTILDAYVDAQLYDFDISPDLSMRFEPTIINNNTAYAHVDNDYTVGRFSQINAPKHGNAIGIQWSIRLK